MFFGIVIIILLYITDLAKFKGAWWPGKSPQCLKLSNSGNALKIWVPQKGIKAICKLINNPFAVTIPNIMETEIGNHGSKSIIVVSVTYTFVIIVKEQRVNGSWLEKSWFKNNGSRPLSIEREELDHLPKGTISQFFFNIRCTLRGFERNYRVLSLSKQRHTYRGYSTLATQCRSDHETCKLDSNWVTGFVDGEGCFTVSISQRKDLKLGWHVKPSFKISLHKRDEPVLEDVKISLHVGRIYERGPEAVQYVVRSLKELEAVINHFHKFPLKTKKRVDFELLKMVYIKIKRKEHLTKEGLLKIVAIRASMNRGLSEKLLEAFPDVVPVERAVVELPKTINPHWLAGFTSGEGSFMIWITANSTLSCGYQVILVFQLTQHIRDYELMKMFIIYLECGNLTKARDSYSFRVTKFKDIAEKIIPFFKKYTIHGVKALDFADWCKVAELIKNKQHLTAEGLKQIKKIKAGMNRGRKSD